MHSPKRFSQFILVVLFFGFLAPLDSLAQTDNRAALVVRYGDGNVHTQCVQFSESQISGYELLSRSGLALEVDAGNGAAICSISGTGCAADDCFCQCTGSDCVYWSYWHLTGGAWQYSAAGSSLYQVGDGVVEGWSWGPGSASSAIAPPVYSFDDVCSPAATATPTNTPVPLTNTPAPSTNTPVPTATLVPVTETPAPQIDFWADALTIDVGSCTTLHWDVENITAVYLDDVGIRGQGLQEVCPAQSQTYTLRIAHHGGEENRSLTITVAANPPTATATLLPAALPANTRTAVALTTTPVPSPTPLKPTSVPADETAAAAPTTGSTVIWVTVPPAIAATPASVAVLPPTAVPTQPANTEPVESRTAVDLMAYIVFGLIVAGLSVLLLVNQSQKD